MAAGSAASRGCSTARCSGTGSTTRATWSRPACTSCASPRGDARRRRGSPWCDSPVTGAAAVWREAPPAGWGELLRGDPNATPAHLPELWEAFAGILPGYAARFAAVEEGGELVGGAAAMIERRAGLHWIHSLPMVLPGAPLARPGRHADVDRAVAA